MDLEQFYAGLAPYYHLIYPDWEKSIERQASQLDGRFFQPIITGTKA